MHLVGLMLWRGGLLLAGGWSVYETLSFALRYFDLPTQLEVGIGLVLTGALFVMVSLVLERIEDARSEGDLRQ
jgi:hypothetical protein